MQLIGCRKSDFKGDNGELVSGWNLYVLLDDDEKKPNVIGNECDRVFLTDQKLGVDPTPYIGTQIEVVYNKYGKVSKVYFERG